MTKDGVIELIEQITVDLGQRSYDILIGPGLIDRAGAHISSRLTTPRAFIITDTNVAPLLGDRLAASLGAAGIDNETIVLPAGEATKFFGPFENLLNELLQHGVERATTLVALGGGVIGDITGFAASHAAAWHQLRASADNAAGPGRQFRRRENGDKRAPRQKPDRQLLPAPTSTYRYSNARHSAEARITGRLCRDG